jgi:hypothetical protein
MKLPWAGRGGTPAAEQRAPAPNGAPEGGLTIQTSEKSWFTRLARAYKTRTPVLLIDDAKVGIDPQSQSLVAMGVRAGLSPTDWAAVGVSIGISAAGITMVVLAFFDPEPTSKLGLLVAGGAVCVLTGGLTAVGILTRRRPPNIQVSPSGFNIRWE